MRGSGRPRGGDGVSPCGSYAREPRTAEGARVACSFRGRTTSSGHSRLTPAPPVVTFRLFLTSLSAPPPACPSPSPTDSSGCPWRAVLSPSSSSSARCVRRARAAPPAADAAAAARRAGDDVGGASRRRARRAAGLHLARRARPALMRSALRRRVDRAAWATPDEDAAPLRLRRVRRGLPAPGLRRDRAHLRLRHGLRRPLAAVLRPLVPAAEPPRPHRRGLAPLPRVDPAAHRSSRLLRRRVAATRGARRGRTRRRAAHRRGSPSRSASRRRCSARSR